jgi:hypothetical protein
MNLRQIQRERVASRRVSVRPAGGFTKFRASRDPIRSAILAGLQDFAQSYIGSRDPSIILIITHQLDISRPASLFSVKAKL